MRTVYLQATTGVLHARENCGVTSRTRYYHFPVEFDAERQTRSPRCARCWDGFRPGTGEVEAAESRLSAYLRENHGPLWGEEQEQEAARLTAELRRLYDAAGTPQEDRRSDV